MADNSAQAEIRGLNIDKIAKGFADEDNLLKQFCEVTSTSAREIRWYQKTSGFLDSTDTTAITGSQIANVSFKARPVVVEQSWTRQTSYIRKYFVESPLISMEDIKDSDVSILATNVRDLTRAVARQVDQRIYDVLTESLSPSAIQTAAAVADGWDDAVTGDPIFDLLNAKQKIRTQGYNPEGSVLLINPIEHRNLIQYLISVKGSSIPNWSSNMVEKGVVMNILGLRVVVSENATTDYAVVFVPKRAISWKSFAPITATSISDPGIGTKIRVWEEGEAILTDPKAVFLITDTVV